MSEERRHLELPDRRKGTYADLEKRIDEHAEYLEERLRSFFLKALIAFAVIGVTSAIGLFGFAYTIGKIKDTRYDFVYDACTAQNKNHEETVKKFNEIAKQAIKDNPDRAKQIQQNIKTNLGLIDTLAPVRDCTLLARISVGDATPTAQPTETPR